MWGLRRCGLAEELIEFPSIPKNSPATLVRPRGRRGDFVCSRWGHRSRGLRRLHVTYAGSYS